ncbi:MAG: hypothetical protein JWP25_8077 [Bradyrhizobium sp.]|nr:hypothetical protein [Bradyrhizobium sp.]
MARQSRNRRDRITIGAILGLDDDENRAGLLLKPRCLAEEERADIDFRFCVGFRMPASNIGATYISGRRPKAAKEGTRGGMGRGECRALRYGDLADAEGVSAGASCPLRRLVTRLAGSRNSG